MPGWSSGQSRKVRPRFPGRAGDVRASRKIQLASRALEVQTFWPSMRHSHPSLPGAPSRLHQARLGAERAQVGSRPGLGESLAPAVRAGQHARQESPLLLFRAHREQRVADHLHAEVVGVPSGRRAGLGEFLDEHDLLELAQTAPAVLSRPGHADQPVLVQQRTPSVSERLHLIGRQRADPGPARRQRSGQEGAYLAAERLGLGRVGQVHGIFPAFSPWLCFPSGSAFPLCFPVRCFPRWQYSNIINLLLTAPCW